MWPFTLARINELADLIETHIYDGTSDVEVAEMMDKAGRAGGKRHSPTDAVRDSVVKAVEAAGARLARETETTATGHHVEIARIDEQAKHAARRMPELVDEAHALDASAAEFDAQASAVLAQRTAFDQHFEPQAAPDDEPDDSSGRVEDRSGPVDLNNSLARLKKAKAKAKVEAARLAEVQRKADIRAKEAKRLDDEHQRLIGEAAKLRAEAQSKRDEHSRLKQLVADGDVKRRDLLELLRRLPIEGHQAWTGMESAGEFLWSRYCDGYNREADRRKGSDASAYVSTAIDFEEPRGLGVAADAMSASE